MPKKISAVLQLQKDAVNSNIPVGNLLRMAKLIPSKLDQKEDLIWIEHELNGYEDAPLDSIPSYRYLVGISKGYHPHYGVHPLTFLQDEEQQYFSKMVIKFSLACIEAEYKKGNHNLPTPYAAEQNKQLVQYFKGWGTYNLHINSVSLFNVLEKVRNLILNWTLELEKKGIIGKDMNFTEKEKGVAPKMSPIYNKATINGNVGVMGNISDSANMRISQTQKINIDQTKDFLEQAMQGLRELPDEIANKLEPLLNELNSHLMISNPIDSQMKKLLTAIHDELLVASGTVIGQALFSAIRTIIGN